MSLITHIGKPGSFSHAAARLMYGADHTYLGLDSFSDVFRSVAESEAEIGVIPIENSLAGSIYENYDLFSKYAVQICAEQYLKVEHFLLCKKSSLSSEKRLQELKIVYSHPKALEQCRDFFASHPHLVPTVAKDTATAAYQVATSDDQTIGAIGSLESAHLYRLDVIASHIQDDKANYTRFVYITKSSKQKVDTNKVSLEIEVRHEPGSLVRVLEVLNIHRLNMTKIESRPIHGKPFEYLFYLDFEFAPEQRPKLETILDEITTNAHRMKILGIYQAGKIK